MKYSIILAALLLAACSTPPQIDQAAIERGNQAWLAQRAEHQARIDKANAEANARVARTVALDDRLDIGFHVLCGLACQQEPYFTLPGHLVDVQRPSMAVAPFNDTTVRVSP